MNYETMRNELLEARKSRDTNAVNILSAVVGDLTANAEMIDGSKVVTEKQFIATVKKYVKGINELLSLVPGDARALAEKTILEKYLPTALNEDQLETVIKNFINSSNTPNIGSIMQFLKTNYANQYDGKLASAIAQRLMRDVQGN